MASFQLPAPSDPAEVAQFIQMQLPLASLDLSPDGAAYLQSLMNRGGEWAIAAYRRAERFNDYATALDKVRSDLSSLLERAATLAGYETIDESILRRARDLLCPALFFCD